MSPAANSPPPSDIPSSNSTVHVHIINTTSRIKNIPFSVFVEPPIKGLDYLDCPAFSFLIEHPTNGRKLLFDLGVRKDWKNLAPRITDRIRGGCWQITVEKDVAEILQEGGVKPEDIDAIIWRWAVESLLTPWGPVYSPGLVATSIGTTRVTLPRSLHPPSWLLVRGSKRRSCPATRQTLTHLSKRATIEGVMSEKYPSLTRVSVLAASEP